MDQVGAQMGRNQSHASYRPGARECDERMRVGKMQAQGHCRHGKCSEGVEVGAGFCRETSRLPTLSVVAVVVTTTTTAAAPGPVVAGRPIPVATSRYEDRYVRWLILGQLEALCCAANAMRTLPVPKFE